MLGGALRGCESTECVCGGDGVVVVVGGLGRHLATMTTPCGQVGGVRAPAWLLLGGLLRVQLRHATLHPASGGDVGRRSWERGGVAATRFHSQTEKRGSGTPNG